MAWKLDSDRPIYIQLVEQIQLYIVSGKFPGGGRLPSVRELAAEAGVNPNTMQKAFAELERDGLVITNRTAGRFVTEDSKMVQQIRQKLASEEIHLFLEKMKQLGFEKEELLSLLKTDYQEGEKQYDNESD
ncbi:MAG: GntR family transcriptional regulator [Lachnospiraceae bacterium]